MTEAAQRLAGFLEAAPRVLLLTGAGVSTDSGIPDYRDADGSWKRRPPITGQVFRNDQLQRARYWARSLIGWPLLSTARPNAAHQALAELQARGRVTRLVTQNVDGLHQAAGSREVIDLHGRIEVLICLGCGERSSRASFQQRLLAGNPGWATRTATALPDGDADLEDADFGDFIVPGCARCDGLLKPDVVFFGDNVPRERVDASYAALDAADGLLVVGSSLMVWSGYRFAVAAHERGLPIAVLTQGRTRADGILELKLDAPCAETLSAALAELSSERPSLSA